MVEEFTSLTPMSDELENMVKTFVAMRVGMKVDRLKLDTSLVADLGIDDEDVWELIEAFGNEFEVDISRVDLSQYVGPEALRGCNPAIVLYYLVRGAFVGYDELLRLQPLTIRQLVESAKAGEWRAEE